MKVKVYVNQHESVSHIQIRHAYDFSLCFLHELLMSFLRCVTAAHLKGVLQQHTFKRCVTATHQGVLRNTPRCANKHTKVC